MRMMVEHVHQQIANHTVDVAIDFTMGNGFDTLALSKVAKVVYSFDIQEEALSKTKQLLQNIDNVKLMQESHLHFDRYTSYFDLGIFNLGYLPNGNHQITTTATITLEALKKALLLLRPGGNLYIVVYVGHVEGKKESAAIMSYVSQLHHRNYHIAKFSMVNKKQAPYVIEIEKRFTHKE